MGQRLFAFTVEAQPADGWPRLEAALASARRGPLVPGGVCWDAAGIRHAMNALGRAGLASIWVHTGARVCGDPRAVTLEAENGRSVLSPAERCGHLDELAKGNWAEAAHALLRNEPWDAFFLRVTNTDAAGDSALARIVQGLSPDIGVFGFIGVQAYLRTRSSDASPLSAARAESMLPTALRLLDLPLPGALEALAMDLNAAPAAEGYSREDEEAIQARLEDLGYL